MTRPRDRAATPAHLSDDEVAYLAERRARFQRDQRRANLLVGSALVAAMMLLLMTLQLLTGRA